MIYQAKLSFTVSIEVRIQAPDVHVAKQRILDYENLILSQNWCAEKAPKGIKKAQEVLYFSQIVFKKDWEESAMEGLKLG